MLRSGVFSFLRLGHRRVATPWLGGVRGISCPAKVPNDPAGYFHSEAEARELFEKWCKRFNKRYPSEEEKQYRFGVFQDTLELSTRKNQKIENPFHRCFGTNGFADLTTEEFSQRYTPPNRWPMPGTFRIPEV